MAGETAPKKIGRGYQRNLDAGPLHPMVGRGCRCLPA
jgi:hypothetical protein